MCLLKDKKVRNNHHKENGYCVAYKIIRTDNYAPFQSDFKYSIGINISERSLKFLINEENNSTFAFSGLHLFLSLKETKDFFLDRFAFEYVKIIKVFYKPEDVLFYGHSIDAPFPAAKKNGISVVVKSCLVKSLEPLEPIIWNPWNPSYKEVS